MAEYPPPDEGWVSEIRFDGYRLLAWPGDGEARPMTRNGHEFFYVFDLLGFDGWDLRPSALVDRKAALEKLDAWKGMLKYSQHAVGNLNEIHQSACGMGLEGSVIP